MVIINSVLVASFNHILSVFKVPSTICAHIDHLLMRFWWRSLPSTIGVTLAPTASPHLLKGLGGLGLRLLGCFNKALLGRQGWRMFHNPKLLVLKLLFSKYPSLLARPEERILHPSWSCRGLQEGLSVVATRSSWKVSDGSRVHILVDKWVLGGSVSFRSDLLGSNLPTHVSYITDPQSNTWDVSLVHRLFNALTVTWILILERPWWSMNDFVYWKYTRDGSFTTKSAYALLLGRQFSRFFGGRPSPE
ncbi:uncharacterized protein LOC110689962 [Chenopodium quinoa]|uniref:uncharacterized protein LOC110689962 n=1 Tax=Chenopodium quinoa TaxID=63459 RepID=UPI000B7975BA|nr:uncharacterized protein LOC110689962 [Chenopodium quinoa]